MSIIDFLSGSYNITPEQLKNFISTCPYRYKEYTIPKKNGKGRRKIAQPTKEVKLLQKSVHTKFLQFLPIHDACIAYSKNKNIRDNALAHAKGDYVLKMDFENFFLSITPTDLLSLIDEHLDWKPSTQDKDILSNLFFYRAKRKEELRLSIGAPTSPKISNSIMYNFDEQLSEICNENDVVYTRYADDITFSTHKKNFLFEFPRIVESTLGRIEYPRIKINKGKTLFLSRKGNITVTGLVITNKGEISIGRKKKRYIKSLVYKYISNTILQEEKSYLSGYLSFCHSVEPTFIESLESKYGSGAIAVIMGRNA